MIENTPRCAWGPALPLVLGFWAPEEGVSVFWVAFPPLSGLGGGRLACPGILLCVRSASSTAFAHSLLVSALWPAPTCACIAQHILAD